MNRNSWKYQRFTGGNRRKLHREYCKIINFNTNVKETDVIQDNVCSSLNESGQTETPQQGSVGNYFNTTHSIDLDEVLQLTSSDEEESLTEYFKNLKFRDKLRKWAIDRNIGQIALKDLLSILNERFDNLLPIDPRTLLQTPKEILIKILGHDGEYWHNGISGPLTIILQKLSELPEIIYLNINFDGLPIHKSSKKEFWPILANIYGIEVNPFIIGVYFGTGKPKSLDLYLEDFVSEMKNILQEGLRIENRKVTVRIRCFICDSTARAFIKGVCNFNGIHGCLKCTTEGEYSYRSRTVAFSARKCPNRNNEDFRAKKYGDHHKTDSPLLELPIDMVQDFPVADSLHLIDLGIMKRLLVGWRNGNFGIYTTKWCARDITKVDDFLKKCKMPSEIHRAVRTLDCLAFWKGSEFRTFLYYLSVVALVDVLDNDVYQHFLSFFCAITICSINKYEKFLPVARNLLQHFVESFKNFYGADYITSNVHNLMHVVDEVEKFGPLQTFNAYPFENKLYAIKNMLRQGNRPLTQLAKRIIEEIRVNRSISNKTTNFNGPFVTQSKNHTILHFKHFVLSSKLQDKYCMTNNHEIVEIKKIILLHEPEVVNIHGHKIKNKRDIFLYPIKSSHLDMFKVQDHAENSEEVLILPSDVMCKFVCIQETDLRYFFPLLHTV